MYSRDTFRSHTGVPGKEVPPYNLVIRYLVEKDTSGQRTTFLVPRVLLERRSLVKWLNFDKKRLQWKRMEGMRKEVEEKRKSRGEKKAHRNAD